MSTNKSPSRAIEALEGLAVGAAIVVALQLTYNRTSKKTSSDIKAGLKDGFCGHNDILISRLPLDHPNPSSWSKLLRIFHEHDAQVTVREDQLVSTKQSWSTVEKGFASSSSLLFYFGIPTESASQKLRSADGTYEFYRSRKDAHSPHAVLINRTTLLNLLILSNARTIYEYSDSSGYRGAFGSWTGQWYINWRAGQPAVVTLKPHDSHTPATDVYAPAFPARVDRCVQMMAGVVVDADAPQTFSVAFPGRLAPGKYKLENQEKGFGLSHGSRHLYNMNGGKVFEIDFLFPRPVSDFDGDENIHLALPSLQANQTAMIGVPKQECKILEEALDKLPWANLSWSMHRGMRDLLLACARKRMDENRSKLAQQLRDAAETYHTQLVSLGWNSDFAENQMGDMAASAVLAGRGNSGDAVRIVTALAEQIHGGTREQRDTTTFWRNGGPRSVTSLEADEIVALVKCFVLEWSQEFNYQMYHQLPIDLLFG